jgi:hypothetical protein
MFFTFLPTKLRTSGGRTRCAAQMFRSNTFERVVIAVFCVNGDGEGVWS